MNHLVVAVIAMSAIIGRIDAQPLAGMEAEANQLANQLDTNSNGFIEMEESIPLHGVEYGDAGFIGVLAITDSNKDGKLSTSEIAIYLATIGSVGPSQADQDKFFEAIINGLDKNNDGFISKDEMAAMLGGREYLDENTWKTGVLMKADKNGDGKMSLLEFKCAHPSENNTKGCNILNNSGSPTTTTTTTAVYPGVHVGLKRPGTYPGFQLGLGGEGNPEVTITANGDVCSNVEIPDVPQPYGEPGRIGSYAIAWDNSAMVCGGYSGSEPPFSQFKDCQILDLATKTWSLGPTLVNYTASAYSVLRGEGFYIRGGSYPANPRPGPTQWIEHDIIQRVDLKYLNKGWSVVQQVPQPAYGVNPCGDACVYLPSESAQFFWMC